MNFTSHESNIVNKACRVQSVVIRSRKHFHIKTTTKLYTLLVEAANGLRINNIAMNSAIGVDLIQNQFVS